MQSSIKDIKTAIILFLFLHEIVTGNIHVPINFNTRKFLIREENHLDNFYLFSLRSVLQVASPLPSVALIFSPPLLLPFPEPYLPPLPLQNGRR